MPNANNNSKSFTRLSSAYYLPQMGVVVKIGALIWVSFWRANMFQPLNWRIGSNPRRQSKNIEMKYKTHTNLCMTNMVHILSSMWRIKNRPYNSTSCSDDALHLLVFVACRLYWGLQVTSSFPIRGCVAFWRVVLREVYFEGLNHGWRHWRLQSWTSNGSRRRVFGNLGPVYTTVEKSTGHEKKGVSQSWLVENATLDRWVFTLG